MSRKAATSGCRGSGCGAYRPEVVLTTRRDGGGEDEEGGGEGADEAPAASSAAAVAAAAAAFLATRGETMVTGTGAWASRLSRWSRRVHSLRVGPGVVLLLGCVTSRALLSKGRPPGLLSIYISPPMPMCLSRPGCRVLNLVFLLAELDNPRREPSKRCASRRPTTASCLCSRLLAGGGKLVPRRGAVGDMRLTDTFKSAKARETKGSSASICQDLSVGLW